MVWKWDKILGNQRRRGNKLEKRHDKGIENKRLLKLLLKKSEIIKKLWKEKYTTNKVIISTMSKETYFM